MEKTKECKVLFNTLIQRTWKSGDDSPKELPLYSINEIILFITKQTRKGRFYDLKDNKFCFLESASSESQINSENLLITGVFKSAKNEYRPDVINKNTGSERKNPKEITEGDIEKTHFIIKIDKENQEVYFLLEYNYDGVNINNIVNYFSVFCGRFLKSKGLKKNFTIKHLIIPRLNFIEELKKMSQTKVAEIYFEKQLLGSKALNFSNRYASVRKELKLVAKAELKESITDLAVDFYNKLNSRKSEISKVRVYGNDENDNEIVLDTSFMYKSEFFSVDINQETGELNTTQVFTGLKKMTNAL